MISEVLLEKIAGREARVGVLGLGYVGLSLAVAVNQAGFRVYGYDIKDEKMARLMRGDSCVTDVPDKELKRAFNSGRFDVGAAPAGLAGCDIFIIAVPTDLDAHKVPKLEPLHEASNVVAHFLDDGLVVLESTVFPGALQDIVIPRLQKNGRRVERDFLVAASPERIDPGNREYPLSKIPKLVGGIGEESGKAAVAFYETFIDEVVQVKDDRVAMLSKLLENTYRAVNIALVNELMMIAERLNVDIWDVVEAANTKPFGFASFRPGPGVGGSCIPVDPMYLVWKVQEFDEHSEFIEIAAKINERVPRFLVERVTMTLNEHNFTLKDSRILVIGVTYKPDVADLSQTPAIPIIRELIEAGASIVYHDPFVPRVQVDGAEMTSGELSPELVGSADLTLILTNHSAVDYEMLIEKSSLVFDSRNQYGAIDDKKVYRP